MFVGEGPWSFHRGNRKFLLVCLISRWCNFSSQRFRNWVDIDPKYAPSARSCTASSTRGGRGQVCCPCSLRIRTFSWSTSPSSHFPLFASLFSISRVWSWCRFQPQKSYGKGACCLLFHRSFLFLVFGITVGFHCVIFDKVTWKTGEVCSRQQSPWWHSDTAFSSSTIKKCPPWG